MKKRRRRTRSIWRKFHKALRIGESDLEYVEEEDGRRAGRQKARKKKRKKEDSKGVRVGVGDKNTSTDIVKSFERLTAACSPPLRRPLLPPNRQMKRTTLQKNLSLKDSSIGSLISSFSG